MLNRSNYESTGFRCDKSEFSNIVEVGKSKFIVETPFEAIQSCFNPNCYLAKIKVIGGFETGWIKCTPNDAEIVGEVLKLGHTSLPIPLIEQVTIKSKVEDSWNLGVFRKETSTYKVTTTYLNKLLSAETLTLLNEYFKLD